MKLENLVEELIQQAREEGYGEILRLAGPRGAIRCVWCKQATIDCECKRNLSDLLTKEEKV